MHAYPNSPASGSITLLISQDRLPELTFLAYAVQSLWSCSYLQHANNKIFSICLPWPCAFPLECSDCAMLCFTTFVTMTYELQSHMCMHHDHENGHKTWLSAAGLLMWSTAKLMLSPCQPPPRHSPHPRPLQCVGHLVTAVLCCSCLAAVLASVLPATCTPCPFLRRTPCKL